MKFYNMKNNKNKGISLISLVITIIILLILAGIAVGTLNGKDGLFTKTKEAKQKWTNAQEQENETLNNLVNYIDEAQSNNDNTKDVNRNITISKEEYDALVKKVDELSSKVDEQNKKIEDNLTAMSTWKSIDANIALPTTQWTANSQTFEELKGAKRIALYDKPNDTTIYIDNVSPNAEKVIHTLGFGTNDAYNFSSSISVDFSKGTVKFTCMRIGNNVINNKERYLPLITKIYYQKY